MSPSKRNTFYVCPFTFVRGYSCISERLFYLVPPGWEMNFREFADFPNCINVIPFRLPVNLNVNLILSALNSCELPDMTGPMVLLTLLLGVNQSEVNPRGHHGPRSTTARRTSATAAFSFRVSFGA